MTTDDAHLNTLQAIRNGLMQLTAQVRELHDGQDSSWVRSKLQDALRGATAMQMALAEAQRLLSREFALQLAGKSVSRFPPQWRHECPDCAFLDVEVERAMLFDLYYCRRDGAIYARHGNELHDVLQLHGAPDEDTPDALRRGYDLARTRGYAD